MTEVTGTARVKRGMAEMLKGGVIMDVVNAEQAKIAEDGTTFSFADGTVMNFDPGQIWIALTDKEPDFTSPPVAKTK